MKILYYLNLFFGMVHLLLALLGHPLVPHLPLAAANFFIAALLRKGK